MRTIRMMASLAVLAVPLVSLAPSARADNDLMGQVQKFFNNDNDNDHDRNAYQRGREDEMRRQQAERRDARWRREHDRDVSRYQRDRDDRYRDPNNGYNYR